MRIAIHGYGRMGRTVERLAPIRGHRVSVIFEQRKPIDQPSLQKVDVVIDFSSASAVPAVVEACCQAGVSLVTGTTGWDDDFDEIVARCRDAGIAMVHAANFSPGATLLFALARQAGNLAASFGGFEAGVEERHHSKKKDSPSGTALRLAEEARAGSNDSLDIPIASSRVGEEYGLHTLFLDSADDLVELSHRARSRDGFARGAIIAGEKLEGRKGVFTFEQLILAGGQSTR